MENILNILKEWSPYILSGLIVVLDVLILLLKRRPKTIDDFMSCLDKVVSALPGLISKVERPGDGENKKALVVAYAFSLFKKSLGRDLSDGEYNLAKKAISEQIESILSTPQKKEVPDGAK